MKKNIFLRVQSMNALFTGIVLLASFYFQYVLLLNPCPLCLMQRLCVFILLAVMLFSLRSKKRIRWAPLLQMLLALLGLFFAFRQLWLQSLPAEQIPACMPGLDILIRYFPWQTVAHALFWGSGDCASETWSWLGLSMPAWSAGYFLFVFFISLLLFVKIKPSSKIE